MKPMGKFSGRRGDSYRIYMIISFTTQFLFSLVFTVNLLYQVDVAKLTPLQLILVGTVLEVSAFLFEVPTGVVADAISRKLSIVIGYALIGIGFVVEGSLPVFEYIALAQVIWGIGYTFTSGAIQAWITDEVGEDRAGMAFIRGAQAGQAGELAAIPACMAIGLVALNLPIVTGGVAMIAFALFLIFSMGEREFKHEKVEKGMIFYSVSSTINTAYKSIKGNRILLLLLSTGFFYGLYSEGFDRLWTAHLAKNFSLPAMTQIKPIVFFGVIRSVLIVLSILVLHKVEKLIDMNDKQHVTRMLIAGTIVIVVALAGFSMTGNLFIALILFWLIGMMRSVIGPLLDIWLNRVTSDPEIHATMFSLRGQVDAIGQIAGGPAIGTIGNLFSIRIALLASAMLLAPVLPIFRKIHTTIAHTKTNAD